MEIVVEASERRTQHTKHRSSVQCCVIGERDREGRDGEGRRNAATTHDAMRYRGITCITSYHAFSSQSRDLVQLKHTRDSRKVPLYRCPKYENSRLVFFSFLHLLCQSD